MSLRAAGLLLAGALLPGAYVTACPVGSEMLRVLASYAPLCFEGCPQLCGTLDGMVAAFYTAQYDEAELQRAVCDSQDEFACAFGAAVAMECAKALAMGAAIGLELPMSMGELDEYCATEQQEPNATHADDDEGETAAPIADVVAATTSRTAQPTTTTEALGTVTDAAGGDETTMTATAMTAIPTTTEAPTLCSGNNSVARQAGGSSPSACFERCAGLCEELETVASLGLEGESYDALERRMCDRRELFICALGISNGNAAVCRDAISVGELFGAPESLGELFSRCSQLDDNSTNRMRNVNVAGATQPIILSAVLVPLTAALLQLALHAAAPM